MRARLQRQLVHVAATVIELTGENLIASTEDPTKQVARLVAAVSHHGRAYFKNDAARGHEVCALCVLRGCVVFVIIVADRTGEPGGLVRLPSGGWGDVVPQIAERAMLTFTKARQGPTSSFEDLRTGNWVDQRRRNGPVSGI